MSSDEPRRRGGWLRPARAFSFETLVQASVLALDRWDRLDPNEQRRFALLARGAGNAPKARLTKAEYRELRDLWKRLEVGALIREAAALVARGGR
jgi:hypothetical protein